DVCSSDLKTTSVATTPIVVAAPSSAGGNGSPLRIDAIVLTNALPSFVRAPAIGFPLEGSNTSPIAFTATIAPTLIPFSFIDDVPIPPFIARAIPKSFPTVAPAPAPTLPSGGGVAAAAWQAL